MTKSGFDLDEIERLLAAATPGEWSTCIYDAGDCDHYDHNGPCPSVQAESADCAIVHWDGFKQEYWSSANGNQRQIEANAALIVVARNSLPAMLTEIRELRAENARLKEALDEDGLAEIITDTLDMDWQPRWAAQAIRRAALGEPQ